MKATTSKEDQTIPTMDAKVARLAARWEVLRPRKGTTDYDVAVWARDVRDVFSGAAAGRAHFLKGLGFSKGDVFIHSHMARAIDAVPSVAVWRALGGYCSELRRVSNISDPKTRTAACKRIVDAHEQIRATTPAPAVLAETKRVTKVALDALAPREQRTKKDAAVEPHFSAFVKRMTSTGYAFIVDKLTPVERAAAGLPADKGKKSKAS